MPHGFMNPAEAATPRFMRAGNVLRFARSPWPPAPLPPPGFGLALGLKSYLSQVSAGPCAWRMVKRSTLSAASSSWLMRSWEIGGFEGGTTEDGVDEELF